MEEELYCTEVDKEKLAQDVREMCEESPVLFNHLRAYVNSLKALHNPALSQAPPEEAT